MFVQRKFLCFSKQTILKYNERKSFWNEKIIYHIIPPNSETGKNYFQYSMPPSNSDGVFCWQKIRIGIRTHLNATVRWTVAGFRLDGIYTLRFVQGTNRHRASSPAPKKTSLLAGLFLILRKIPFRAMDPVLSSEPGNSDKRLLQNTARTRESRTE